MLVLQFDTVRAELRPMPSGRSLKIKSPLLSRPVRMLRGGALDQLPLSRRLMFLNAAELNDMFSRCRMSPRDGPHSSARSPVAGTDQAPSELFRSLPR